MSNPANKYLIDVVTDNFQSLMKISRDINYLFSRLQTTSNSGVAIFGGAVRDWWLGKSPKDIDIVIDTDFFKEVLEGLPIDHNKLGGNAFVLDNVSFDVWNLKDTYAFRSGQFDPSWDNLVKSVPFNIDSVLVMLYGSVYEHRFWEGIENQTIDFVNKIHPDEKFIAQRALNFSDKYQFKLSDDLDGFVKQQLGQSNIIDGDKIEVSKRSSNFYSIPELDI